MRYFLFTAATLCLFLSGCGGGSDDDGGLRTQTCGDIGVNTRIVNGGTCSTSGSPVVPISILNADGSTGLCSGTMLTPDDVLTAAHCFFEPVAAAAVEVNGERVFANTVVIHPEVGVSGELLAVFNDVAILQLRRPISAPTLPLLGSRAVAEGDEFSIYGYGIDLAEETDGLRSGEMRVSSVTPNHIFANFDGDGSNTCNGDSGGPAVLTTDVDGGTAPAIIGVVSSGNIPTCEPGDLSLFANIQTDNVFNFILAVVPDAGVI